MDISGAENITETKDELNKAYSPSSCLSNEGELEHILRQYRQRSNDAKEKYQCKTLQYGDLPSQTVDYFPAEKTKKTPLHIFIHGGYWQELSKDDSCFFAPALISSNCAFAAINYTLAPIVSIDEIVEECRLALTYLYEMAEELGFDSNKISISGSSAGAHLCAEMMMMDWTTSNIPADIIKSGLLISGIYDLRPLVSTYINDAVKMDIATAKRNSPLFKQLKYSPKIVVAWGENETEAFKKQSKAFVQKLADMSCSCNVVEVPKRNHFDVVFDFCDENSVLSGFLL